jgi:hypothetical protein
VPADHGVPAAATAAVRDVTTDAGRVTVELDAEQFAAGNRYVVHVDGRYAFETHAGTSYYASRSTTGDTVHVRGAAALRAGSVVTVTLAAGTPGEAHTTGGIEIARHVVR